MGKMRSLKVALFSPLWLIACFMAVGCKKLSETGETIRSSCAPMSGSDAACLRRRSVKNGPMMKIDENVMRRWN